MSRALSSAVEQIEQSARTRTLRTSPPWKWCKGGGKSLPVVYCGFPITFVLPIKPAPVHCGRPVQEPLAWSARRPSPCGLKYSAEVHLRHGDICRR